jgi:hypothetical protein
LGDVGRRSMSKRWDSERERRERDRERRDRKQDVEQDRRAETERRGEELREAWRQHHPQEKRERGGPEKGGTS